MNIQEFAAMLNGREYRAEITRDEAKQAKELGFVVVYGASDDLVEFDGAIYDEDGCYGGKTIYLTPNGVFEGCEHDPDCACKYIRAERDKYHTIEVIWAGNDSWCWQYETDIPHATFDIFEDGEKYCRGIVFDIKSLGVE